MTGKSTPETMPRGATGGMPQVLLAHHLKPLRLSFTEKLATVLEEYDKMRENEITAVIRLHVKTPPFQRDQRLTAPIGVGTRRRCTR